MFLFRPQRTCLLVSLIALFYFLIVFITTCYFLVHVQPLSPSARSGFLTVCSIDVWGRSFLAVGDCPVHSRTFSNAPGLQPRDVRSTLSPGVTTKTVPGEGVGKITPPPPQLLRPATGKAERPKNKAFPLGAHLAPSNLRQAP